MGSVEIRDATGRLELHFTGDDGWDGFDAIGRQLMQAANVEVVQRIDGPEGTRIWTFRLSDVELGLSSRF